MIFDPSMYVFMFRIRSAPMGLLNDFLTCLFLIRFDPVMCWIRIVQKVLYTVDLMNESMDLYIYFRTYICIKKGFSMNMIKMSLKMLGQKSIQSCFEPFASSMSNYDLVFICELVIRLWPRIWFATSYSLVTSYPIWPRIKRDLVFDMSS